MKIAVFISGTGTNLKALLEAERNKYFSSEIVLVVANKEAGGLDFAKAYGKETLVSKDDDQIIGVLKEKKVDLIVLAGFLPKLSDKILEEFVAINIHPALLPKYGGKGFYGMNVHRAVFENREKISGATVHYVNGKLDDGDIILQREVDISDCKDSEEVAKRVLTIEHGILKDAIKKLEDE
ncbi:MAG: phosphoribosylglycinamide formyltransferase [Finegoldia sp.]|nr:phosphoribosylglycinamide formyltransferase [Finegoldia sp.]